MGTIWEYAGNTLGGRRKNKKIPVPPSLPPITSIFEDDVIGQFHVILSHPFLVQKFRTRCHNKFSRKKRKPTR
jgi:hypothetical protein